MEEEKAQIILSERMDKQRAKQKLKDKLKIWHRTSMEDAALKKFWQKVKGYRPQHEVQQNVINFAHTSKPKYINLGTDPKRVDSYIEHSAYWEKNHVTINKEEGGSLKLVFAENKEMMAVIFLKEDKNSHFIISTYSTFENYLRKIEGTTMDKQDRTQREELMLSAETEAEENLANMLTLVPEPH